MIAAVITSIGGGLFAWMLVTAEQPYSAARHGIFPGWLAGPYGNESMSRSLFASSAIMQVFLLLVIFAEDVYLYALNITGLMILPAYLFSGLFLIKTARRDYKACLIAHRPRLHYAYASAIGLACTLFCIWMLYAAGLMLLLQALCFYIAGLPLYKRGHS